MMVVCLQKDVHKYDRPLDITIGKVYYVYEEDNSGYKIKNDKGQIGFYWKGRFKHLDSVRDKKLESIGI